MVKITEEVLNQIRELASQKKSHKEIAEIVGRSRSSVHSICAKYKIVNGLRIQKTSDETLQQIRELAEKNYSHKEIAEALGKDFRSIKSICTIYKIKNGYRHGYYNHPMYNTYNDMIQRCTNENVTAYHRYGGRGITICKYFIEIDQFCDWGMANGWTEGLECDRIENDGNYSCGNCEECQEKGWPLNCRFSTREEQMNNVSTNRKVTAFGETKNFNKWVKDERCQVSHACLHDRLSRGWDAEKAITTPSRILVTAWGETKSISEWGKDSRCNISTKMISVRLKEGKMSPEDIISKRLDNKN